MLSDQTFNLQSLKGKFDTDAYPSPYCDVVALMVFEHQMHMINLITRFGWVVRLSQYQEQTGSPLSSHLVTDGILRDGVHELVDYMLFVDEASLPDKIQGTSGFAETFSARGPRDSRGRSLRQFDLQRQLMRFPCSYVIYSEAFDGMPDQARSTSYKRMWQILSGEEKSYKYSALSSCRPSSHRRNLARNQEGSAGLLPVSHPLIVLLVGQRPKRITSQFAHPPRQGRPTVQSPQ